MGPVLLFSPIQREFPPPLRFMTAYVTLGLIGMQNLLAASLWVGVGSRVLAAALSSAYTAARQLLAHSEHDHYVPERRVLKSRAVQGSRHH